jgi:translation elongation factor EF-Ts
MKNLFLLTLVFSAQSVLAASFSTIPKVSNAKLSSTQAVMTKIIANESMYGECGSIQKFSYTKNKSEKDINTIKQLMIKTGTMMTDYDEYAEVSEVSNIAPVLTATNLLDPTFTYSDDPADDVYDEEQMVTHASDVAKVTKSLYKLTEGNTNSTIKLYDGLHGYEDGAWNVLTVMDTKNREIVIFTVGICGT